DAHASQKNALAQLRGMAVVVAYAADLLAKEHLSLKARQQFCREAPRPARAFARDGQGQFEDGGRIGHDDRGGGSPRVQLVAVAVKDGRTGERVGERPAYKTGADRRNSLYRSPDPHKKTPPARVA